MISFHGQTDVGRRRSLNEDAILANDRLFVVCDGMGGHKAGEVASQLAVDVIATFVKASAEGAEIIWPYGFQTQVSFDGNRLSTAIKLANQAVFHKAVSSDDYAGMGTTVAAMILSAGRPQMTYAHVGDSRVYLIRPGVIVPLTRDDSWVNFTWGVGALDDSARTAMKHVLTKALGARADVDFEVTDRQLSDGDVVLLCSDGLTNMVPDRRILDIVSTHGMDLEDVCAELVTEANTQGGHDNISVILVRYSC